MRIIDVTTFVRQQKARLDACKSKKKGKKEKNKSGAAPPDIDVAKERVYDGLSKQLADAIGADEPPSQHGRDGAAVDG